MNPITIKDWKLIRYALSYALSNWDDVIDAFGEEEGYIGPSGAVERLLERAKLEANEARKLALSYFKLYPKEDPHAEREDVLESIDCTYKNWLDQLYAEPAKSLSKTGWNGKVTKAYFKMIGFPCPCSKKQMVNIVTQRGQQ